MSARATSSERAVDRDPRLRRRLLRQFDRGERYLRPWLRDRFGAEDAAILVPMLRVEYAATIERLPWIGGRANPRSFNLYGAAFWLALWRVLEPRGVTLSEARGLFCDLFRAYWSRYPRPLAHLYGRVRVGPVHQRRLARLAAESRARAGTGDYVYRFVPGEPGRFDVGLDITECAIVTFLRAEGAEELAPVLCELDWPHTELLGLELERTSTLARGGERCDFRLRRRGARDVGLDRASWPSLVGHGVVGWAACAAVMAVSLATLSLATALVVHALAAPIIFAAVAASLYLRSDGRAPLVAATVLTAVVIALDATVVAGLIEGSFAMFASPLGTWVPFAAIFLTVYVVGAVLWCGPVPTISEPRRPTRTVASGGAPT